MNTVKASPMRFSRKHKTRHRNRKQPRSYKRYTPHHNFNRRRRKRTVRHQRRHQQKQRFRQSGGDLLNYLPSDLSMAARSAAHSLGGVWSGVKGVMGSDSPLPYNDHHLQKSSVSVSDHLPDLKQYYENANALIPAL